MRSRGQYGNGQSRTYVGQGSFVPHSAGEAEAELDQLHAEIMGFGQEVVEQASLLDREIDDQILNTGELLVLRTNAEATEVLVEKLPRGSVQRSDAVKSARRLRDLYADRYNAIKQALKDRLPKERREFDQWRRAVWKPFFDQWMRWRGETKDIPLQMWPGSGTWDHIQDYRKQFIDLRSRAPFKAKGPTPLDPRERKDPSLANIFGDVGKLLKYGAYAVLGIGAVVALSSVASNLRSGKDPGEKYMELIRERRRPRAPRALPGRARPALPPGEPEDA